MKKKNIFLIIILLFLVVSTVSAANYPKITDFVTDNAGIIDSSYKARITELAKQIEQQTTVEVAVVTVNSLEGIDIETYAVELFESLGIGKKDLDNGLLILIAPNERKYRIEVGYGLEGTMPDIKAREIGIMKSIGAKNKDIMQIFLLKAAFIGLIGGIIGVFFGIMLSGIMPMLLGDFRLLTGGTFVSVNSIIMALSVSIIVGILAGIIPAYQASKLRPVDALRYE